MIIRDTPHRAVNLDKLTYAGSLENVAEVVDSDRYAFERADIADADAVARILKTHRPDAMLHLAAESHVDRSIDGPRPFIETNIVGTYTLLEEVRRYLDRLSAEVRRSFRFVQVSTDEVYGSLGTEGRFMASSPYDPSSPYSASKASADHLARAWHRTFGLPIIVTNCSNNFGPFQYPEKLIPVVVLNLLADEHVPIYGRGDNVRDWLFVDDHARALLAVMEGGKPGKTYLIGASNERSNLEVVRSICSVMDELAPRSRGRAHSEQIKFVADRPGHDFRYAIDASPVRTDLKWSAASTWDEALRRTVQWYIDNRSWCARRLGSSATEAGGAVRIGLGGST